MIIGFLLFFTTFAQAQDFDRVKGYYRVYQTTDSTLAYFWDGYMEIYVPLDSDDISSDDFCERKFLGERRRKLPDANGDDIFIQMNLPNLETHSLTTSILSDEYSTRNNGDVYMLKYKAGNISKTDSTTTITMDELAGRPNHELDMSQLKMYGIVATMTAFDESETRTKDQHIVSFSKHMAFKAHYKGEDKDENIDVVSEFFATDRQRVSRSEMRRIKKQKNHIWEFSIPSSATKLPQKIAEAWPRLVEY